MAQVHVLTGPERRRRWSAEQKRAIVAAAFAPGAIVAEVARRADVCAGQIYRWRQDLRGHAQEFAEVMMVPVGDQSAVRSGSDAVIEVRLASGAGVRIPATATPGLASAIIKALAGR
ncbi:IS66-like element accessory protein TnpA [Paramagnetospirillum magneticum]|uniref:Transposase IS3/IS911 family protein n=1 Tax=Paramagnetospirillum caucaseum TaxID=1244869 RepID=M3A3Y0_9PROT|nr:MULTISPECIES: transposase [Paramagnetospirillum]EME67568.1 transposase IS3/IS911 family protein [Paramagnetospirillum caucaseum]